MMPFLREATRRLSSITLFFWIAGILGALLVAGTLLPAANIYHQGWFLAVLGMLAVNTVACVLRRWRGIPWPSLISHIGVLLVLAGGWASLRYGKSGDLELREGGPALHGAWGDHGPGEVALPFEVSLKRFRVEFHDQPTQRLVAAAADGSWNRSFDVRTGGTYAVPEADGVELTVDDFVPDFFIGEDGKVSSRSRRPNNPALHVQVGGKHPHALWVFANYPGMHQDGEPIQLTLEFQAPMVKQFRSDVELRTPAGGLLVARELSVNHPLRYGGFALYQNGYDPDDPKVSVLRVTHDPGTNVVFLGCLILMVGLTATLMRRKA